MDLPSIQDVNGFAQWLKKRGGGGAAFLDKLYVIFFPNYFEQPLLICYIAYLLIVNHLICCPMPRRKVA